MEEFEEGSVAAVVAAKAAAGVDHIAAQDLSMGVGDVRIVHSIDAHTLLRVHKPPRNSRR